MSRDLSRRVDKFIFFFQAEDGIRDRDVTGVQTCALPISIAGRQAIAQTTRPPAAHASSRRCRRSPNAKPALGARPRAAKMAVLLPSWIPILAGTMNSTPSTAADSVSMEMIVDADTRSPSERQMRYASTAPHAYAAAKSDVAAANRPR